MFTVLSEAFFKSEIFGNPERNDGTSLVVQ